MANDLRHSNCACVNIRRASRAICHLYDLVLGPTQLKATQFNILRTIDESGEIAHCDLATDIAASVETLSRRLANARKCGWVRMQVGKNGRRLYSLTPKGKRVLDEALPTGSARNFACADRLARPIGNCWPASPVNVTESVQAATIVRESLPPKFTATLLREYLTLVKARITAMVMFTAWCGAYLAANQATHSAISWPVAAAIFGIGLVAAGTAAANQVMERDTDAKMRRTAQRPLVTGTIPVSHAIAATLLMIVGGTVLIAFSATMQAALLTLATSLVYILVYTPLKKVTPLCTAIGAIPGAMPILLGWVAIRGRVDWQAALLFAILFFWQFPHFHAISLLYAEDYRRGNIRMLPVVEPDGVSTHRRIVVYSFVLLGATLLPTLVHMTGFVFGIVALVLGAALIVQSFRIAMQAGNEIAGARIQAHRMLLATVLYLPALMIAFLLDHAM